MNEEGKAMISDRLTREEDEQTVSRRADLLASDPRPYPCNCGIFNCPQEDDHIREFERKQAEEIKRKIAVARQTL